jgi:hypothetical protein
LPAKPVTLQSIDSSLLVGSVATPPSTTFLQTQLSRYETELADWCNCPSGKTPAGKLKIADLQAKTDAARAQLEQVETVRSQQKVAETTASTDTQSAQGPSAADRFLDVVV